MDLISLGRLIAARRCARGLTLVALASAAGVGRSTLAALESGKLPELGFNKVARICAAAGIVIETCPPLSDQPHASLGQLADAAGHDLSREAVRTIIRRGDIRAWQELADTVRADESGRLAARVRWVVGSLGQPNNPEIKAFVALLPGILRNAISRDAVHPPRLASYHVKLGRSL